MARCNQISPDLEQISCVLTAGHSADHRGVLWSGEGTTTGTTMQDYYWPRAGGGKHRKPVPSAPTHEDVWPASYDGKHRAGHEGFMSRTTVVAGLTR